MLTTFAFISLIMYIYIIELDIINKKYNIL